MIENNLRTRNEFYIAPLYNLLINDGLKINTFPINKMYHMGTPDEMNYFINNLKYSLYTSYLDNSIIKSLNS